MPSFVALDVETANPDRSSICQIGAVVFEGGRQVDRWSTLVDPQTHFDPVNVSIHGISESRVRGQPRSRQALSELSGLVRDKVVVTHTGFDQAAVTRACDRYGEPPVVCRWLDSSMVARRAWPEVAQKGYGLASLAARLGITFRHHDAGEDAFAAGQVLVRAVRDSGKDLEWWLREVGRRMGRTSGASLPAIEVNPDGELYGETVVFTGSLSMPRAVAAAAAMGAGCAVATTVNKHVTIVVVGDQDADKLAGYSKSSKHRRAEELIQLGRDIRILCESDFQALLAGYGWHSL